MTARKIVMAAAMAALASSGAYAESGARYFGVSGGMATLEDFCGDVETSCDDSAPTLRVHSRFELDRLVGWEVGYRYIDDVEAAGAFSGVRVGLDVNGHLLDTDFQLVVPETGPLKVIAKAGALLWRLNYKVSATNGVLSASDSDHDTGYAFKTGVGMSYEVSDSLRIRADWDYLMNVGDEDDLGETDISIFSIGPEFRF